MNCCKENIIVLVNIMDVDKIGFEVQLGNKTNGWVQIHKGDVKSVAKIGLKLATSNIPFKTETINLK